eukprot:jgi/Psemu1/42781/gm1.42781_g
MPVGTQTKGTHSPTTRGVTPDTSINTSRITDTNAIRTLRDQLEELELGTEHPVTGTKSVARPDDEMTKKKDYTSLKDHLDEAPLKPITEPTSIDIYEFKKTLVNALAEVTSIKYIQGGGYAFLLETEAQYQTHDPNTEYPMAPSEPHKLDGDTELTSDAYKLWKHRRALYLEWNKYDREALLIDLILEAFPRGTTALNAFQTMEEDLCSTDAQHQLMREITKKMNTLAYTPSPIGPKEYFRQLTEYQAQINLLPETANVTPAQMINYSREAFMRSKHDPITLHRVNEDWKQHKSTITKDEEFVHYKRFWGQRLKELYSVYNNKTASANMVDIQNDQRFADLESKQHDLANVCQEIYSQVTETATAASTMTMSHQWETAMVALQADVNRLKTNAGRAKAYKAQGATFDNQMGGANRNTDRWMKRNGPNPNGEGRVTFAHDVAFHIRDPPGCGALHSAATDHFVPSTYQGGAHQDTLGALTVGCANGSTMLSTATYLLDLPRLPLEARRCHKFDEVELPLVLVPKLCSNGCHVEFSNDDVAVISPTQQIILTGQRDPLRNLYMVPLHQPAPPKVKATSPRML